MVQTSNTENKNTSNHIHFKFLNQIINDCELKIIDTGNLLTKKQSQNNYYLKLIRFRSTVNKRKLRHHLTSIRFFLHSFTLRNS